MINILIVDDDKASLEIVHKCVREIVPDKENVTVVEYQRADVCLKEIEKRECHILISDVDMPNMCGIKLAKKVREINPRVFIIFVTAYVEFAVESYRIDAQQYILKSEVSERLPRVLSRLVNSLEKNRKDYCFIGSDTKRKRVLYDDIIWLKKEKGSKYVRYITVDGGVLERITFENAMNKLDSVIFTIVGRGCAVNLKHVMKLQNKEIYLSNRDKIAVSKKRTFSVKSKIYELWSKEGW